MKVTIAIPTISFGRLYLLKKEVESIHAGTYKDVHIVIVVDGNFALYEAITREISGPKVSVLLNKEQSYWVASVNRVWKEFDSDYYVYASDDIIFPSNCIRYAVATIQECFPDDFGLISLTRRRKAGFGLFSHVWADYFPDRQVLCPDYIQHGADREITQFAYGIGKYDVLLKKGYRVEHFKIEHDETWNLVDSIAHKGPEIRHERRKKGYLWGDDFNLITK